MNRSPMPTQAYPQALTLDNKYDWLGEQEIFSSAEQRVVETPHCLFAPIHYERGYAYPLIVWLHGLRSNEQELRKVMPHISMRNHVAVAPRGDTSVSQARGAFGWDQTIGGIAEAGERVMHCVEMARQRFHLHPERVFVAGTGSGGTMALRLGMEHPEMFAGAISLGGPVPQGFGPLKRINEARQLPLLLSVSPHGESYSLTHVMEDLRLLHYAGFSLSLQLHPDGDPLTTTMLSYVDSWIMEQICPTASAASA